ncbi:MAG: hypothetical protein JXQ72_06785 [Anaerolineae bacterium]|nr:hypothetical protein [Anaerolineae bacterium]
MNQWIRVSCASLCRIEHAGRFFLLLNQNRREKGIYILSPIGGALTIDHRADLDAFAAIPEDETTHDLRMIMPVDNLPDFKQWFYRRQGREISPFRELNEELVDESGLLSALRPEDVTWDLLRTAEDRTFTQRQGSTGLLTQYFLEIYRVRFTTEAMLDTLLAAPPDSGAAWVTLEQITQRGTISLTVDGATRETRINGHFLLVPPE